MLKAGEFSPNNPLTRVIERSPNDVFVGLGEYERRRNTLRKIQQQQYREFLDQQAKKKQEEKEMAKRERREREENERRRDEERERLRRELEQSRDNEQRCASVCYVPTVNSNKSYRKTVDTGVQVGLSRPLSVACQTDDELYTVSPDQTKKQLTQAERELSPRTVADLDDRPIQPAHWRRDWGKGKGDSDVRTPTNRASDKYTSILDADAIEQRNVQALKEAAERRQFYQQELKNQILEQQRIKEERKTREKLLEQAEMRRLEEQLRMLRMAQEKELTKQFDMNDQLKQNTTEFEKKRTALQKDIDSERMILRKRLHTSQSESQSCHKEIERKLPFSTNIPETSIFSPNYDVESYLRRNLNPSRDSLKTNLNANFDKDSSRRILIEKALVHDWPKEKKTVQEKPRYEPSFMRRDMDSIIQDETPIPVLENREDSPKALSDIDCESKLSDKMKLVDDKWKVPAVQKNILKSVPSDGKNLNILTQLGSIRRQLQLEQLRLDNKCKSDKK